LIPKRISLTNFICYRDASLDFSGFRVACVAGPNGAGKSALLDAVTWALWGRARARRDDELVHFGTAEMAVEFDFALGRQEYRVVRRRRAGKRGSSMLDFQVRDQEGWRSISENTIRLTQAKIEQVLRLDYDTFVNSAFLRQGRADEFTTKTPAERKRVLGDILGLERWVDYEDRVKERQAAVRAQIDLLELRLEEIDAEVARRPAYEESLAAAQATLSGLAQEIDAAEGASRRIETARAELRHCQEQIADLTRRIDEDTRELERLTSERLALEGQVSDSERLLKEADAIAHGYGAFVLAQERERALGAKLLQSVELTKRQTDLEARVLDARRAIQVRRDLVAQRIADLERRLPSEEEIAERDAARATVAHLMTLVESRDAAQTDLARISEERAALRVHNGALKDEMVALREKIAQLEQAQARCPLCDQPLSEAHRRSLLEQFQDQGRTMGDSFRANRARAGILSDQAAALERQIAEVLGMVRPLEAARRREAALGERIESGERVEAKLDQLQSELAAVEEQLKQRQFGQELRRELSDVLEQAEALGYDHAAHRAAREDVAKLRTYVEQRERLAVAERRRAEARAALELTAKAEAGRAARRDADATLRVDREQKARTLRQELAQAPGVASELDRVRRLEAEARQELGAAVQRIQACETLEAQRGERAGRLRALNGRQAALGELRTAFGVRGVPAMIIEAAVPEIEAETNRLLARMTGGRMHVRLDTQRETLAGDVRETLEIAISDEAGTRTYATYSGGEQYRINFAMRVALAKLLARRAGARLETLVVDEGFGTQDSEGRQRLVEAIGVVREDFARILVITHIEELMDAFPVRIQVSRTGDGSKLTMV
jgi:exonuclease SbcC